MQRFETYPLLFESSEFSLTEQNKQREAAATHAELYIALAHRAASDASQSSEAAQTSALLASVRAETALAHA